MAKEIKRRVPADESQIILDLPNFNLIPPEPGIYDEPVRYYKANLKWAKLIEGFVWWLATFSVWRDAEDESFPGVQEIITFLEGIELPESDFDCGDVEDCLSESEIIAALNAQIAELNSQIDELEEQLEEVDNSTGGGTTLPENPTNDTGANDVCKAANYIADRLVENMLQMWADAQELTLQEWMQNILSVLSFDFAAASDFWQKAITIGNETLADDAAAFKPNLVEALFCSELNYEQTLEKLQDDPGIPTDEKALLITVLDNYKQAKLNEWASIGTLGTTAYDCSGGCPMEIVWDFVGDYVPTGGETAVYTGDTWDVTFGEYVAGEGYVGNEPNLFITHPLPQQCRVYRYEVTFAKSPTCGRGDLQVSDGTAYSAEQFTVNNFLVEFGFDLAPGGVVFELLAVHGEAVICSDPDGMKIGRVRILCSGAEPGE